MKKLAIFSFALFARIASAQIPQQLEDTPALCGDGVDNDRNGTTDCADPKCDSSSTACQLPDGPLAIGIGAERPAIKFDIPMATDPIQPLPLAVQDLVVVDLDGPGGQRDDVVSTLNNTLQVRRSVVTPGFVSVPSRQINVNVLNVIGGSFPAVRAASGDFLGADGRADVVVMNGTSMRRYQGSSTPGTFTVVGNATPNGTGAGVPVVLGTKVITAGARLRVYDAFYNTAPAGFPSTEVFGQEGLAASVTLPGATSRAVAFSDSGGRKLVAVVVSGSTTVQVYLLTDNIVGTARSLVVGAFGTFTSGAAITDLVFNPADDMLVLARADGFLQMVQVRNTVPLFASVVKLPPFAPDAVTPRDMLARIAVGPLVNNAPTVAVTTVKSEDLWIVPYTVAGGWQPSKVVRATFDSTDPVVGPQFNRTAAAIVMGQFNDDTLLDVAVLDSTTGSIMIVRQQPPPVATFISASAHGMMPLAFFKDAANTPILGSMLSTSFVEMSRYGRLLSERERLINAKRAPVDGFRDVAGAVATQGRIRHIDVRATGRPRPHRAQALSTAGASRGSQARSSPRRCACFQRQRCRRSRSMIFGRQRCCC